MLKRTAGNCFWLARYLERAENTARLVGVAQSGDLLGGLTNDVEHQSWHDALRTVADLDEYRAQFGTVAPRAAASFLLLDRQNLSSVVSCLRAVRENARTARNRFTNDFWEACNSTWMEAQQHDSTAMDDLDGLLAWALEHCQWIRGTAADLFGDEVPEVLSAGLAIERVDFTTRLLLVHLPELIAAEDATLPGSRGYLRWDALISAVSGQQMYRQLYRGVGSATDTAHLLVLHPRSPRSLFANLERLERSLPTFTGGADTDASMQSRDLRDFISRHAQGFASEHASELLTQVLAANQRISAAIWRDHFNLPDPNVAEAPVPQAPVPDTPDSPSGSSQSQSQSQTATP